MAEAAAQQKLKLRSSHQHTLFSPSSQSSSASSSSALARPTTRIKLNRALVLQLSQAFASSSPSAGAQDEAELKGKKVAFALEPRAGNATTMAASHQWQQKFQGTLLNPSVLKELARSTNSNSNNEEEDSTNENANVEDNQTDKRDCSIEASTTTTTKAVRAINTNVGSSSVEHDDDFHTIDRQLRRSHCTRATIAGENIEQRQQQQEQNEQGNSPAAAAAADDNLLAPLHDAQLSCRRRHATKLIASELPPTSTSNSTSTSQLATITKLQRRSRRRQLRLTSNNNHYLKLLDYASWKHSSGRPTAVASNEREGSSCCCCFSQVPISVPSRSLNDRERRDVHSRVQSAHFYCATQVDGASRSQQQQQFISTTNSNHRASNHCTTTMLSLSDNAFDSCCFNHPESRICTGCYSRLSIQAAKKDACQLATTDTSKNKTPSRDNDLSIYNKFNVISKTKLESVCGQDENIKLVSFSVFSSGSLNERHDDETQKTSRTTTLGKISSSYIEPEPQVVEEEHKKLTVCSRESTRSKISREAKKTSLLVQTILCWLAALALNQYQYFSCDKTKVAPSKCAPQPKHNSQFSLSPIWVLSIVMTILGATLVSVPNNQQVRVAYALSSSSQQQIPMQTNTTTTIMSSTSPGKTKNHSITRTEELESAVLATMLATQSTLGELNSSLPRPNFLPATSNNGQQFQASKAMLETDQTPSNFMDGVPGESSLGDAQLDSEPISSNSNSARSWPSADEFAEQPEEALIAATTTTAAGGLGLGSSRNISSFDEASISSPKNDSAAVVGDYLESARDFFSMFIMGAIIIGDICGNSLVILSVCRHSKLRVTTNWFVVSLACADILVALFAMTFNASLIIWGRWLFKPWVCDFWNSCDVLASTASILHLCCISIDRYIAIMRPLDYPMKITTRRVMYALCAVWVSSALLSYIPIFTGIYTTNEHIEWRRVHPEQCDFVVNRVYAIVSSSISFWIPCSIMVFTYYRIFREASRQEKFIYKAQSMMPAPMVNHHHSSNHHTKAKQRRSKSMAVTSEATSGQQHHHPSTTSGGSGGGGSSNNNNSGLIVAAQANERIKSLQANSNNNPQMATTDLSVGAGTPTSSVLPAAPESEPLTLAGSAIDLNNNNNNSTAIVTCAAKPPLPPDVSQPRASSQQAAKVVKQQAVATNDDDDRDSNSGQSTPTKRSISKMKREHKAAKTLGIIMGVFILCWLPFFSWYTPQHICGRACDELLPRSAVTLLFWIGYFNSTLNPIIYAYFNHEFRDAFKKTLQWIFCCCQDLKCLRVNRPNENQHYNCTYRSTQEIGLVTNG